MVRAYANKTTLSAPRLRERLTRAGVDIVEVSDVSQAADERLMSDVYVRARDANDADVANELATIVMTGDARLSICVEQSRVRGLLTIALSDYLRTWRSRPEFRHLFQKFAKEDGSGLDLIKYLESCEVTSGIIIIESLTSLPHSQS